MSRITDRWFVQNEHGQYWTGTCWGVKEAKQKYSEIQLIFLCMDKNCHPGTYYRGSDSIIWGSAEGEIFAVARKSS